MSKYDPLYKWLRGVHQNRGSATFTQLDSVLGFELPTTARTRQQRQPQHQNSLFCGSGFPLVVPSLIHKTETTPAVTDLLPRSMTSRIAGCIEQGPGGKKWQP